MFPSGLHTQKIQHTNILSLGVRLGVQCRLRILAAGGCFFLATEEPRHAFPGFFNDQEHGRYEQQGKEQRTAQSADDDPSHAAFHFGACSRCQGNR